MSTGKGMFNPFQTGVHLRGCTLFTSENPVYFIPVISCKRRKKALTEIFPMAIIEDSDGGIANG